MVLKLLFSFFFLVSSPIWPLGDNPTIGDPFIIVNVKDNQLAFFQNGEVLHHSVATGKEGDETPIGLYTVTVKAENPYYRKRDIRGGDPKNPLGSRWIGFDANDTDGRTYGIHGTNRPNSIGYSVTAGCIRLPNRVVEALFDKVPLGTKILITDGEESFEQLARKYGAID
ncbi:L,D-transpeptidase [Halalkalibacter urbisdiaboli]|uniref:L,D-transpeptidase n=1 Tax=Halalkalibacter urbisdiaboli TaxID=1960589 RepID=UPI003CC9F57F